MSTQALPLIKNYIDREQLGEIIPTCDLWVTVSPGRLLLYAASKTTNRVAGLTVLELADNSFFQKGLFELREWLEGLELFGFEYKNTHLVFETTEFTIVPEVLFVQEKADVLLKSLFDLPKFWSVKNNRMDSNQCVNVFSVPDIFFSTMRVLFPQAAVHHYAEFLLQSALAIGERNEHTLFVHMHQDYLDILHIHGQELKFINTFAFEADTDIIYFILSVAEQQRLSVDKLQLMMMGDINVNGPLLQLLKKYVPHVNLYKRPEDFSFPVSFREFQEQQYFLSTAFLLCG